LTSFNVTGLSFQKVIYVMADPTYTAAKPGDFFCPSGGTW
jgi:hypothetical protein